MNEDDLKIVVDFVLDCWPGYEDAVSWGDHMDPMEHDFYAAAKRLREKLEKPT